MTTAASRAFESYTRVGAGVIDALGAVTSVKK
jgi:hypothetical protein